MKNLLILLMCLVHLPAEAGSSVGNFSYRNQIEFDFRIGFFSSWTFTQNRGTNENLVESWILSNWKKVPAEHGSFAQISFLDNFPATSKEELLAVITRRHPEFKWEPIKNPDFTIGFVSDQKFLGMGRTRNFEYYFSKKNKVIRIEALRDQAENGAAEMDTILSTIRRPSGVPKIVSIKSDENTKRNLSVGDLFCYRIEVDPLRGDFTEDSLTSFNVKGAHKHWSFKAVSWDKEKSSFKVCLNINSHFGPDGLSISDLSITSSVGAILECKLQDKSSLQCSDISTGRISYNVPTVANANPTTAAPKILSFKAGPQLNSIHVSVEHVVPLSIGMLTFDSKANGKEYDSQIIYSDKLSNHNFDFTVDAKRLKPGFTRILRLMITDQVGNMSELRLDSNSTNYTLYSTDKDPVLTSIPVVSVIGGPK